MTYLRSPRSNIWRRNWSKRNSRRDHIGKVLLLLAREEPDVKDLPDLTTEVVRRYKLALARHVNEHTGRSLTRATQTYFLIAIRSMLRYWTLQGMEVLAPDRIELGKAASRFLKFL